jgi:hypothetical protein
MTRAPRAGLTITYEATDGQSLAVATVKNEKLLRQAALVALSEAQELAHEAAEEDSLMGEMRAAEAQRLLTTLALLIPGFNDNEGENVQ